jgi:hypothetical protein
MSETFHDMISGVYYKITKTKTPFYIVIENATIKYTCTYTQIDYISELNIYGCALRGNIKFEDNRFYVSVKVTIGNESETHKKYLHTVCEKKEMKMLSPLDFTNIEPLELTFKLNSGEKCSRDNCDKCDHKCVRKSIEIGNLNLNASWMRFDCQVSFFKIKIISGDKYKIFKARGFGDYTQIWLPITNDMRIEILEIHKDVRCITNCNYEIKLTIDAVII